MAFSIQFNTLFALKCCRNDLFFTRHSMYIHRKILKIYTTPMAVKNVAHKMGGNPMINFNVNKI